MSRKRVSFRRVTRFGDAFQEFLRVVKLQARTVFEQLDDGQTEKIIKFCQDHEYLAEADREEVSELIRSLVAVCECLCQEGNHPISDADWLIKRLGEEFDRAQAYAKNRDLYRKIGEKLVELSRRTPEGLLSSLEYNRTIFEFCRPYVMARVELVPARD